MNEKTPAELEYDLMRYAHESNRAEEEWGRLEEEYNILDDVKKEMLSSIMDKQDVKTSAEKERLAIQSNDWKAWLIGYQVARERALKAKVRRNVAIRMWETTRSVLSSRNTERRTST